MSTEAEEAWGAAAAALKEELAKYSVSHVLYAGLYEAYVVVCGAAIKSRKPQRISVGPVTNKET